VWGNWSVPILRALSALRRGAFMSMCAAEERGAAFRRHGETYRDAARPSGLVRPFTAGPATA